MYQAKHAKAKIKQKSKIQISKINYWVKVERKFARRQKWKIPQFALTFPHDIFAKFVMDDESRIELIAAKYGYEIINENLTSNKSKYWFGKFEKNNHSDGKG